MQGSEKALFSGFRAFPAASEPSGLAGALFRIWYSYAIYSNSTDMFLAVFYYNRPVTCRIFSSSNVQHFAARFGCGILTTSVSFSEQTEPLV